jgi:hypothetical protein
MAGLGGVTSAVARARPGRACRAADAGAGSRAAARSRPQPTDRDDVSYSASAITVRNGSPDESKQTVEQNESVLVAGSRGASPGRRYVLMPYLSALVWPAGSIPRADPLAVHGLRPGRVAAIDKFAR